MNWINRVALFLHITDSTGQLDLIDLSFIGVVGKILMAPTVDWQSATSLVGLILAKMHTNHLNHKSGNRQSTLQQTISKITS